MTNILIASLGESPVVVPVMYHLLKDREGIEIDEVHVLAPQGGKVPLSFDLVEKALRQECTVKKINLCFEDANTPQHCIQFLQELAVILHEQQQQQHKVYLSLAGGRKSMAALIAWIVPFFSCIEGLYHVIDPDKEQFPSIEEIIDYPTDIRKRLMRPTQKERDALKLVHIPFNQEQQINEYERESLRSLPEDMFEQLPEETIVAIETAQRVFNREDKVLEVLITQPALKQYEKFRDTDETHARAIRTQYFKKMDSATQLHNLIHPWRGKTNVKSGPVTLHFCKSGRTDVRLVVYTEPKDVYSGKIEEVEKVVICGFEIEKEGRKPPYRSLAEIEAAPHFSLDPISTIDKLMPIYEDTKEEHVLLVPLGTHPMIATQLYTLLSKEGLLIKEIVVFYPEQNRTIYNGVKLLEKVVRDEKRFSDKSITIKSVVIPGRKDIDSEEACAEYQQKLKDEIESLQKANRHVLLSLSGGRKGMAAMAIFVAQKMDLRCVYHTLIEDEKLSDRIEEETTIKALNDPALTKSERNDRLFLRSYDLSKLTLFRVPVLSRELLAME